MNGQGNNVDNSILAKLSILKGFYKPDKLLQLSPAISNYPKSELYYNLSTIGKGSELLNKSYLNLVTKMNEGYDIMSDTNGPKASLVEVINGEHGKTINILTDLIEKDTKDGYKGLIYNQKYNLYYDTGLLNSKYYNLGFKDSSFYINSNSEKDLHDKLNSLNKFSSIYYAIEKAKKENPEKLLNQLENYYDPKTEGPKLENGDLGYVFKYFGKTTSSYILPNYWAIAYNWTT